MVVFGACNPCDRMGPPVRIHALMSRGPPAEIHTLFISLIKGVEFNERRNNLVKLSIKITLTQINRVAKLYPPPFLTRIHEHPYIGAQSPLSLTRIYEHPYLRAPSHLPPY